MHVNGLILYSESCCYMRNDPRIRRISHIAADIACQTKHTATTVGLDFIKVGIEFDAARASRQCDQQRFRVYESKSKCSNTSFKVNTIWVSGQMRFENVTFPVDKNPLIDEGW